MTDENSSFASARARLEEIAVQVREKDTSLEKSLDLLEEGVRIANRCTELLDHTAWRTAVDEEAEATEADTEAQAQADDVGETVPEEERADAPAVVPDAGEDAAADAADDDETEGGDGTADDAGEDEGNA